MLSVAFFVRLSFVFLVFVLLVFGVYKDLRIRNANKPTPVPPSYKAYIFAYSCVDGLEYKVILAPSFVIASQRIRDFSVDQDLDAVFWRFIGVDDFEVAYSNNVLPRCV